MLLLNSLWELKGNIKLEHIKTNYNSFQGLESDRKQSVKILVHLLEVDIWIHEIEKT
jgi:hypothetical protein